MASRSVLLSCALEESRANARIRRMPATRRDERVILVALLVLNSLWLSLSSCINISSSSTSTNGEADQTDLESPGYATNLTCPLVHSRLVCHDLGRCITVDYGSLALADQMVISSRYGVNKLVTHWGVSGHDEIQSNAFCRFLGVG